VADGRRAAPIAEHTGTTITRHTTGAKTPNATKDAGFGDVGAPPAKAEVAANPIHDGGASITMRDRRIGFLLRLH
jgi:hypothetical protein